MLAIAAAVLFAIALILDLADASSGIGARMPVRNGRRWSYRR